MALDTSISRMPRSSLLHLIQSQLKTLEGLRDALQAEDDDKKAVENDSTPAVTPESPSSASDWGADAVDMGTSEERDEEWEVAALSSRRHSLAATATTPDPLVASVTRLRQAMTAVQERKEKEAARHHRVAKMKMDQLRELEERRSRVHEEIERKREEERRLREEQLEVEREAFESMRAASAADRVVADQTVRREQAIFRGKVDSRRALFKRLQREREVEQMKVNQRAYQEREQQLRDERMEREKADVLSRQEKEALRQRLLAEAKKAEAERREDRRKRGKVVEGREGVTMEATESKVKEGNSEVKERSSEVKEGSREVKEGSREVKEGSREVKEENREVKEENREVKEENREVKEGSREVKEVKEEAKKEGGMEEAKESHEGSKGTGAKEVCAAPKSNARKEEGQGEGSKAGEGKDRHAVSNPSPAPTEPRAPRVPPPVAKADIPPAAAPSTSWEGRGNTPPAPSSRICSRTRYRMLGAPSASGVAVSAALVVAAISVADPPVTPRMAPVDTSEPSDTASSASELRRERLTDILRKKAAPPKAAGPPPPPPTNSKMVNALKERANQIYKAGQFRNAAQLYSEAISLAPSAALHLNRSAAYLMMGQLQDSLRDAERAAQMEKNNAKALFRIAKLHLLSGDPRKAREVYSSARKLPSAAPLLPAIQSELQALEAIESCIHHRDLQQWQQAGVAADLALSCLPCLFFQQLRCESLIMVNPTRASAELAVLSETHPNVADLHYLQAKARFYAAHDKLSTNCALQHLSTALTLNPTHAGARGLQSVITAFEKLRDEGNRAYEEKRWKEAYACYTKALSLDPSNKNLKSVILLNRAAVSIQQGYWEVAVEDCNASLLFDDGNYKAFLRRAKCHQHLGNLMAAVKDLRQAVRLNKCDETVLKLQEAERALSGSYKAGAGSGGSSAKSASSAPQARPHDFFCRGSNPGGSTDTTTDPTTDDPPPNPPRPNKPKQSRARPQKEATGGTGGGTGGAYTHRYRNFFWAKGTGFRSTRQEGTRSNSMPPKPPPQKAPSLYSLLGLKDHASSADIKTAYHKLAMKWHPDKWVSASREDRDRAEARFKELSEAYSILSSGKKR